MREKIYLAGDMLNRGSQLQRAEEKRDLLDLGYNLYVPQDNAEINDKANLDSSEQLAEKIVRHDTDGINTSDIIIMEAREGALGTCIEMGQLKGQKDFARLVLDIIRDPLIPDEEKVAVISECSRDEVERKVYVHNSDIRRAGHPTETGDRRSYGPHQYMYGVVLDVTDGAGYLEWSEILNELA